MNNPTSKVVDVSLRVAQDADEIVLDLGDARWRGVRISRDGWRVEAHGKTTFRRASTSLPLPEPTCGGDLRRLRQYVRCDDETWPLLAAWLVAALRPRGPYPILLLTGEQGASKTTTARMLRALVDPSILTVRSEPRDARDLMIAAKHSYVVALDNLSRVSSDVADALCCLSTGGGFAARALYSDSDEAAVAVSRPVILTAIEDIATRGDLLDRALIVRLRAIPESERRAEDELWADFEAARPALVGALCDAASLALRRLEAVRSERHELTRMADFHLWSLAAELAFIGTVSFDEGYRAARERRITSRSKIRCLRRRCENFSHPPSSSTARERGRARPPTCSRCSVNESATRPAVARIGRSRRADFLARCVELRRTCGPSGSRSISTGEPGTSGSARSAYRSCENLRVGAINRRHRRHRRETLMAQGFLCRRLSPSQPSATVGIVGKWEERADGADANEKTDRRHANARGARLCAKCRRCRRSGA